MTLIDAGRDADTDAVGRKAVHGNRLNKLNGWAVFLPFFCRFLAAFWPFFGRFPPVRRQYLASPYDWC